MDSQVIGVLSADGTTSRMVAERLGIDVAAAEFRLRRLYGVRCRRVGDLWFALDSTPDSALANLAVSGAAMLYGLDVLARGRMSRA